MGLFQLDSPSIRNYQLSGASPKLIPDSSSHRVKILEQIKQLGVKRHGFRFSEVQYLPQLIHPDENLHGVVQGKSTDGHVLLAATDKRIIYLDTKPFFVRSEDISYDSISALTFEWVGITGTLILHTRLGDFKIKIRNRKTAEIFRSYVESRCLERNRFN